MNSKRKRSFAERLAKLRRKGPAGLIHAESQVMKQMMATTISSAIGSQAYGMGPHTTTQDVQLSLALVCTMMLSQGVPEKVLSEAFSTFKIEAK